MATGEQLSSLIATIYDTAVDPELWGKALEQTATFVGAKGAVLAHHDTASGEANFTYLWGDKPECTAHYIAHLSRTNPVVVPVHLYCEPGEVFSVSQLISYEEYLRSRLYREWAQPQGWGDFSHFLTEKSGTRFGHFGVAHGLDQSPATDEPRRKLRLLLPHVTRAVAIAKAMQLTRLEAETLNAAVDALAAAVFLIGADGAIVYVNASAERMLDEGHVLRRTADGRLSAAGSSEAQAMNRKIAGLAGDQDGSDAPLLLLNGTNGARYVVHLVSLTKGQRRHAGRILGATAAVFVHPSELKRPTLIQLISKRFGLTDAESRVLFTIIEAGGIQEAAAMLGISGETVRTHLKRLYRKTDTRRQADLVRLVGQIGNPITV